MKKPNAIDLTINQIIKSLPMELAKTTDQNWQDKTNIPF